MSHDVLFIRPRVPNHLASKYFVERSLILSCRFSRAWFALALLACVPFANARAQSAPAPIPDAPQAASPIGIDPKTDVTLRTVPRDLLKQQEAIWTSPTHIRDHDLVYLVPLGLATGLALATDQIGRAHV